MRTAPSFYLRDAARLVVVGVVLYAGIDVLLHFLEPNLSLLHSAESDYGHGGPYAWVMDANFLIRGVLSLLAGVVLWRTLSATALARVGIVLVGLWGVLSGLLAFFPDDLEGAPPTPHAVIHLVLAMLAFISCVVGTLLLTMALRRAGRVSVMVVAVWVIAALAFLALGRSGFHPHSLGGLEERIFIGAELLWIALVMMFVSGPSAGRTRAVEAMSSPEPEPSAAVKRKDA